MRPIPGWSDYFAGNDGCIYSTKKYRGNFFRQLAPATHGTTNYLHVNLCNGKRRRGFDIHILVCLAFNGPRPKGSEQWDVSHLDGTDRNNLPGNLIWETHAQNMRRRQQHGTDDCGSRNSRAHLNSEQVTSVKGWLAEGVSGVEIARRVGCSWRIISRIKCGNGYIR